MTIVPSATQGQVSGQDQLVSVSAAHTSAPMLYVTSISTVCHHRGKSAAPKHMPRGKNKKIIRRARARRRARAHVRRRADMQARCSVPAK